MNHTERLLDHAEKFIPLYKAFLSGKDIQFSAARNQEWKDLDRYCIGWQGTPDQYRVKSDPVVRPYKNLDEAKVAFGRTVYCNSSKFLILGGNDLRFFYKSKDSYGYSPHIQECTFNGFIGYKFVDDNEPVGVKE